MITSSCPWILDPDPSAPFPGDGQVDRPGRELGGGTHATLTGDSHQNTTREDTPSMYSLNAPT